MASSEQQSLLANYVYKLSDDDEVEKILDVNGLVRADAGMTRSAHAIYRHSSISGLVYYRYEYSSLKGGVVPVEREHLEFLASALLPNTEELFARSARLAAEFASSPGASRAALEIRFSCHFNLDQSPNRVEFRGSVWQGSYEWVRWGQAPRPWLMAAPQYKAELIRRLTDPATFGEFTRESLSPLFEPRAA
jgi:hypothetical protein